MKKYLSLLLCVILIVIVSLGCASKNSDTKTPGVPSPGVPSIEESSSTEDEVRSEEPEEEDEKVLEPTKFDTVNNIDVVTMTIKEGTVLPSGLTIVLENTAEKDYLYSEYMWLEKEIDGMWYQVPTIIDDYGFQDIAYMLAAGEAKDEVIDWAWLYGELEKGEYRLIKHVFSSDTEEHNPYYLAVEFEITN